MRGVRTAMNNSLLQVSDLNAWYGKSHVLRGVEMEIHAGEIVALLGRNGVGRSTLAKAIMGMVNVRGSIRFAGTELVGEKTHHIAKLGVGYVPESRDVFPSLSVEQNLVLGVKPPRSQRPAWSIADMYAMFPRLSERADTAAGSLSGGEQQMLTLCRTLMGNPDLILIDEPTEGLAPKIVAQVGEFLQRIKERGVAVLLIEQKLSIALDICTRLYVMGHGQIVFEGTPDDLRQDTSVREQWLQV